MSEMICQVYNNVMYGTRPEEGKGPLYTHVKKDRVVAHEEANAKAPW